MHHTHTHANKHTNEPKSTLHLCMYSSGATQQTCIRASARTCSTKTYTVITQEPITQIHTHTHAVLIKEVFISLCQTVTVRVVWVHKDGSSWLHISTSFFSMKKSYQKSNSKFNLCQIRNFLWVFAYTEWAGRNYSNTETNTWTSRAKRNTISSWSYTTYPAEGHII